MAGSVDAEEDPRAAAEREWNRQKPKPKMGYSRFRDLAANLIIGFAQRRHMRAAAVVQTGSDAIPHVIVCLGSGRCLYPSDIADKQVCPFCLHYTGNDAMECARKVALGN